MPRAIGRGGIGSRMNRPGTRCWPRCSGGFRAGALDEAIQDVDPDGYLQVRTKDAASELFALRVRGESMTGVGILPGDVVIVRRQPIAKSGEIVVALVENDATVKTFKPRGQRVELRPENPAFESIVLEAGAVVILGKVIEVRRTLSLKPEARSQESCNPNGKRRIGRAGLCLPDLAAA